MKPELLHVLQHALGLDQYGQVMSASGDRPVHRYAGEKTYRNHYVTGDDDAKCRALVEMGLMVRHPPREISGGDPIFIVTEAGKTAVIEHSPGPPRLSPGRARYLDYLNLADAYGLSFGEYLKRYTGRAGREQREREAADAARGPWWARLGEECCE